MYKFLVQIVDPRPHRSQNLRIYNKVHKSLSLVLNKNREIVTHSNSKMTTIHQKTTNYNLGSLSTTQKTPQNRHRF